MTPKERQRLLRVMKYAPQMSRKELARLIVIKAKKVEEK